MADTETKKEGGSGGGKLPLALLALNTLLLAAVLAAVLLRTGAPHRTSEAGAGPQAGPDAGKEPQKEAKANPLPGPTVKLPDFVVRLRDPDADRYARLAIEVEVADEKAKELLGARLPAARDAFISYLSDRTAADLRGSDAIARTKADLTERLRAAAPGLGLTGLYLTELVVQ